MAISCSSDNKIIQYFEYFDVLYTIYGQTTSDRLLQTVNEYKWQQFKKIIGKIFYSCIVFIIDHN